MRVILVLVQGKEDDRKIKTEFVGEVVSLNA
jgi:hypothetical protein